MAEQGLLVGWFFVLGAVIGSFLNVVIYRLPRGMSLISPPSHCPACNHRIRWSDNIPVLAWLALRGKCRDCRSPISVRYPAVEAATGCMFALLAAMVFFFDGANLPAREMGEASSSGTPAWTLTQLYPILLYHLLLLCTLFAAAMIEIDRQRVPASLFAPALAVGVIAPFFWPCLRPVAAWPGLEGSLGAAADCAAGLAAGGVLAYAAWRVAGSKSPGTPLGLLCVGVFLGWQAICCLGFVVVLLALSAAALGRGRSRPLGPLGAWLFAATLAWILAWSPIVALAKRITG
jgi:leader peptidase (prepilin peptidase) / N-methyltransferase